MMARVGWQRLRLRKALWSEAIAGNRLSCASGLNGGEGITRSCLGGPLSGLVPVAFVSLDAESGGVNVRPHARCGAAFGRWRNEVAAAGLRCGFIA